MGTKWETNTVLWHDTRRLLPERNTNNKFSKKNLIKDDYEREIGISIIKKLNLLKLNDQKVPGILVANHGVVSWGSSPNLPWKMLMRLNLLLN